MPYDNAQRNPIKLYGRQLIALTGGIGSGKSYVLQCFAKLGFITIDTDSIVHKLLQPGTEVYSQIAKLFPECLDSAGAIDREQLFSSAAQRGDDGLTSLEAIIHPAVWEYRRTLVAKLRQRTRRSIVIEIPLFFERTQHHEGWQYDQVISTICPPDIQKARAMQRNNMTDEKFRVIFSKQVDNVTRLASADLVVDTAHNKAHVFRQIVHMVEDGGKRQKSST